MVFTTLSEPELFKTQNSKPWWVALEFTALTAFCLLQGRMRKKSRRQFPSDSCQCLWSKSTARFQTEEIHSMVHKQTPLGKPTQRNQLCSSTGQTPTVRSHTSTRLESGGVGFFKPFLHDLIFLLFYFHYFTEVSQFLLVSICSILSATKSTLKFF